jgi:drug/metabolite transporter (DMT)-like permease
MIPSAAVPARLGAFLAIVFWGVSFVATKAVVAELSPWTLVFARTVLGAALLVAIQVVRRQPPLPPRDAVLPLLAMGFVGVAFHQTLQAVALRMTTATNTGWLIGLTPVWSALFAWVLLRERFGPAKLAGLVAGFAGATLVVTRGRLGAAVLALPATQGDLLILLSTLNWAAYTVMGHATIRRLGPTRATAGGLLFGALLLLPVFALRGGGPELARLSLPGWFALLFLGLACSGLGYLFWYAALERLEASRVAAFLYLEPLVTLAAARIWLGEGLPVTTLVGGALLLAGVVLVQRAR